MNTKFTRAVFALLLVLSALGISASAALADQPTKTELNFPASGVLTGVSVPSRRCLDHKRH